MDTTVFALTASGLITIFSAYRWMMARIRMHAAERELSRLTYQGSFNKKKLEALERHFRVAPYATRDSNMIIGMQCSACNGDYTICEDRGTTYTTVCPKCFKVKSAFEQPKE